MLIEGVTVCINYSDYLRTTLPLNRDFFDRLVVVTVKEDEETVRVALEHDCTVVLTSHRTIEDEPFNIGKMINDGLRACTRQDWLCKFDSDIALPPNLRLMFPRLIIDWKPSTIYGMERRMCNSFSDWEAYAKHQLSDVFPREDIGYPCRVIPVGFFQLWQERDGPVNYPENFPTASDSDLAFAGQFKHHHHFPITCIHLSADPWQHGTNYSGRVSRKWGT